MRYWWEQPRLWTPASLPNLLLWADASDPTTISGSGSTLVWKDKSGKGANLSAGSGSLGLVPASNSFNSHPGITLNGTNDWLVTGKGAVNFASQPFSYFLVFTPLVNTTGNGRYGAMMGNGASKNDNTVTDGLTFWFGNSGLESFFANSGFGTNLNTPLGNNYRAGLTGDGTAISGPTASYLNGALQGTGPLNGVFASTFAAQTFGIGGNLSTDVSGNLLTPSQFDSMVVAEVVLCNAVLTAAQIAQLDAYFQAKWGLFNPASIANLALWLDAADVSKIAFGTSPAISGITDKSGNSVNASQITALNQANQNVAAQNGLNSVKFTSSPNAEYYNLASSITANAGYTVFAVGKKTAPGGGSILAFLGSSTDANLYAPIWYTDGVIYTNGVSGRALSSVQAGSAFHLFTAGQNAAETSGFIRLDRTDITSVHNDGQNASLMTAMNVFGAADNIGFLSDGEIGEILFYTSPLTAAQISQVESYLRYKWGTP